jgi:sec-independent protein translocase protein TatA
MFWKILIVALILLLLFGSHRLARIGQNLGQGVRNFKKGLAGEDDDEPQPEPDPPAPKQLPPKREAASVDDKARDEHER